MKRWVKPRTEVQVFEANEYVAACWAIACTYGIRGGETGINNPYMSWREGDGATHTLRSDGTGCGHEDNQYITENANGTFSVMEINTQGLGNLNTRLTTNSSYRGLSSSISDVEPGGHYLLDYVIREQNMVSYGNSVYSRLWSSEPFIIFSYIERNKRNTRSVTCRIISWRGALFLEE